MIVCGVQLGAAHMSIYTFQLSVVSFRDISIRGEYFAKIERLCTTSFTVLPNIFLTRQNLAVFAFDEGEYFS